MRTIYASLRPAARLVRVETHRDVALHSFSEVYRDKGIRVATKTTAMDCLLYLNRLDTFRLPRFTVTLPTYSSHVPSLQNSTDFVMGTSFVNTPLSMLTPTLSTCVGMALPRESLTITSLMSSNEMASVVFSRMTRSMYVMWRS